MCYLCGQNDSYSDQPNIKPRILGFARYTRPKLEPKKLLETFLNWKLILDDKKRCVKTLRTQ
jgi:hypothetical protein